MTNPMTMVERASLMIFEQFPLTRAESRGIAKLVLTAAHDATDADFGGQYGTEPRKLFAAMIDAALSEGEKS